MIKIHNPVFIIDDLVYHTKDDTYGTIVGFLYNKNGIPFYQITWSGSGLVTNHRADVIEGRCERIQQTMLLVYLLFNGDRLDEVEDEPNPMRTKVIVGRKKTLKTIIGPFLSMDEATLKQNEYRHLKPVIFQTKLNLGEKGNENDKRKR